MAILMIMICLPLIQMWSLLHLVVRNVVIFWMIKRMVEDEELDYEPSDDDNDLIVNVTAEDMFESDDEDCQNTSPEESTKPSA